MRIVLIQLQKQFSQSSRLRQFLELRGQHFREYSMPHLGLLTVAALTPRHHDVVFLNENITLVDPAVVEADVVGISVLTQSAHRAYWLADALRGRGIHVVLGGIHPTVLPDEAQVHCDTVVMGEAEQVWPRFLRDLEEGHALPRYSGLGAKLDLTESPVPCYELLNETNYQLLPNRANMFPLQTSRGCPRGCEFCSASVVWGRTRRVKAVSQVMREVRAVKRLFKCPMICFADDNLFMDVQFGKALLKELRQEQIQWMTQTDLSVADDDELLELIFRSGCSHLFIGLESVDSGNLLRFAPAKRRLHSRLEERIARLHRAGIVVYASMMLGLDNDTPGIFRRTRDFILANHLVPHFCVLTPLPGTPLFRRLEAEGRLLYPGEWHRCTFFDVTIRPRQMSPAELEDQVSWLFEQTWSDEAVRSRYRHFLRINRAALRRYAPGGCSELQRG